MRVSITTTGIAAAQERVHDVSERLDQPPQPLLQAMASVLQTYQQDHFRAEAGPDGPWPDLKPATRAIRKHYGHDGKAKLVRAGDLLLSITTLELTDTSVLVGTRTPFAPIVHDGGVVSDARGTRTVQAFPWAYVTEQEEADLVEMVETYYLGAVDA